MKKILLFSLLSTFLLVAFVEDTQAQKRSGNSTDEYFDESGNFASKLWYGANIGNIGGFGNSFNINMSPMIGYKVLPNVSIGVILKFNYQYIRDGTGPVGNFSDNMQGTRRFSALDFSYGAFARYKLFNTFFIHTELETTDFKIPSATRGGVACEFDTCVRPNGKYETFTERQPYFYVGGGYSSGNGVFGYELALLYNVFDDVDAVRIPFDFRIGLTYKF